MRVTLTELAREDWRNIRRYLRRQFGSLVEMVVARQVRAARIAIGENPGRGHPIESAVFAELRSILVKKSLICYRMLPTHVQIVRILDVRQDAWTILKTPRPPSKSPAASTSTAPLRTPHSERRTS